MFAFYEGLVYTPPVGNAGVDVAEKIAEREGIDPLDLEKPLYVVVDVDALDALTNGQRDYRSQLKVEFEYLGYEVEVRRNGEVSVYEKSDSRGRRPR